MATMSQSRAITVRLQPVGDALQFLAVFPLDMRPQHVSRRVAEECPVLVRVVGELEREHLLEVRDLGASR